LLLLKHRLLEIGCFGQGQRFSPCGESVSFEVILCYPVFVSVLVHYLLQVLQ